MLVGFGVGYSWGAAVLRWQGSIEGEPAVAGAPFSLANLFVDRYSVYRSLSATRAAAIFYTHFIHTGWKA
jgi:hypothetical protein